MKFRLAQELWCNKYTVKSLNYIICEHIMSIFEERRKASRELAEFTSEGKTKARPRWDEGTI